MNAIRFYDPRDEYGWLSNFSRHTIVLGGMEWPTVEHYFQAQKFAGTAHTEAIRQAHTPRTAADLGRDGSVPLRADWQIARLAVKREALRAKFTQQPELAAKLLATDDAELIEASPKDAFWGEGADGSGKNMLGRLLMEVRAQLKAGCGARRSDTDA